VYILKNPFTIKYYRTFVSYLQAPLEWCQW